MIDTTATVFCQPCQKPVTLVHLARHRRTQAHRRKLGDKWEERTSDLLFRAFLKNVSPADFSDAEKQLYVAARRRYLDSTLKPTLVAV